MTLVCRIEDDVMIMTFSSHKVRVNVDVYSAVDISQ